MRGRLRYGRKQREGRCECERKCLRKMGTKGGDWSSIDGPYLPLLVFDITENRDLALREKAVAGYGGSTI